MMCISGVIDHVVLMCVCQVVDIFHIVYNKTLVLPSLVA
jgi:hypothetical protein